MEPDSSTMNRVFALLKHDWVYNFFFEDGPHAFDQLRHAATKGCVSTVELDVTTLPAPTPTPSPLVPGLHVGEHHRLLLMPSFTTGGITVGFAVNEKIASAATVVSRDRYVGRIARDDENGTCLFIAEDFNDHVTEVSYYTLFSPAHREHVFCLYKANRFRQVMKRMRHHYDPSALTNAVIYFYYAIEARPCPTCDACTLDAVANCRCKLAIKRKAHPQDDDAEITNLQSYIGGYSGVASVGFYKNGQSIYRANFASNSATRLTGDPDVQQRLALWALCSAFKNRSVSPLAFTMGPGGLGGEKTVSVLDSFLLASIAESVLSEETRKNTVLSSEMESASVHLLENGHDDSDLPISADEAVFPSVAPPSECSILSRSTPRKRSSNRMRPSLSNRNISKVPRTAVVADSPFHNPEKLVTAEQPPSSQIVPFLQPPQQVLQPLQMQIVPQSPVVMPLSMALSSVSPNPSGERPVVQPHTREERSNVGGPCSNARSGSAGHSGSSGMSGSSAAPSVGVGHSATSRERRQEPVRLAPALRMQQPLARYILPLRPGPVPPPPIAGGVSKLGGDDLDERRRKAEQRKARNRESAQRSNHKRKMRIQALKDDIAAASKREMYLRAREKVLREENRSLRITVSK